MIKVRGRGGDDQEVGEERDDQEVG